MNLKSFGCSFIFGSELSDDAQNDQYPTGSRLTWPAHLAAYLGYDYLIYARPGAGNLQIAERVLTHLATNLHSEIRDKLATLMSVRLVIDTLKQKGCPFIMTYMDDLMFDRRWHTTPAITDLQDYIRPHMTTFGGMNFQQWSKKNGHPITAIGHPLESAHAAAGQLIIKVFDTQNTIDH